MTSHEWGAALGRLAAAFVRSGCAGRGGHSKADQKHGQMFLSTLERYVGPEDEARVVAAAQESPDLRALWYAGLTAVAEELKG